jgi:hypothetical protein
MYHFDGWRMSNDGRKRRAATLTIATLLAMTTAQAADGPTTAPSPDVHRIPTPRPAPEAAGWPDGIAAAPRPEALSEQDVRRAIRRGVDFLLGQYHDGHVAGLEGRNDSTSRAWGEGLDALCAYALLECSRAAHDDRLNVNGKFLSNVLDRLDQAETESDVAGHWGPITYARSLRAMALAVYNRPEDRETLKDDAAWLVTAAVQGAYFYDDRFAQGRGRQSDLPEPPPPRRDSDPVTPTGRVPITPKDVKPSQGSKPIKPVVVPMRPVKPIVITIRVWPRPVLPPRPPPRVGPPMIRLTGPTKPPNPPTNRPTGGGSPIDPASLARPLPKEKDPPLRPDEAPWDNSNSQFGMLGVLACASSGIEIPEWYWREVEFHWLKWQQRDGGWSYRKEDTRSTLAMTCAGLTALCATADWAGNGLQGALPPGGREAYSASVNAALAWLGEADNSIAVGSAGSRFASSDLFSLAWAGTATGQKHFGNHEWYRELAAEAIGQQWPDGSWGGTDGANVGAQDRIVETAQTLLFLARGLHPVMFNKLRFDGAWANHPHDAQNLATYAGRTLERELRWQAVGIERDYTDWLDAPVLYVASQQAPKLSDAESDKLRKFAEAGGMLFTQADNGSAPFNQWAADLAKKLWPAYELKPLPDDHAIYTIYGKLAPGSHPRLAGVSNGSRLLMVHCPGDVAGAWQMRAEKSRGAAFQLGVNLYAYASGKSNTSGRLEPTEQAAREGRQAVRVARLKYAGAWDPEPMAWERFGRWLEANAARALVAADVEIAALRAADYPVAHLTGTSAHAFTAAEAAALRAFVEAGGVLLIDRCGGGNDGFVNAVRDGVLSVSFADVAWAPLPEADADKSGLRYRDYVLARDGALPRTLPIQHAAVGRGHVYVSRIDLVSGLLGTRAWGIYGLEPRYARELVSQWLAK